MLIYGGWGATRNFSVWSAKLKKNFFFCGGGGGREWVENNSLDAEGSFSFFFFLFCLFVHLLLFCFSNIVF
jgi:hypothetical protein